MLKPNSLTAWDLMPAACCLGLGAWGLGLGTFESPELYLTAPSYIANSEINLTL